MNANILNSHNEFITLCALRITRFIKKLEANNVDKNTCQKINDIINLILQQIEDEREREKFIKKNAEQSD